MLFLEFFFKKKKKKKGKEKEKGYWFPHLTETLLARA